jgi:hypothetical protein
MYTMPRHFLNWDVAGNPLPYSACPPLLPRLLPRLPWHHVRLDHKTVAALRQHANARSLTPTLPPKGAKLVTASSTRTTWTLTNSREGLSRPIAGKGNQGDEPRRLAGMCPLSFSFHFFILFRFFIRFFIRFLFADYVRLQEDHYC